MSDAQRLLCGLLTGLVLMAGSAGCTSPAGPGHGRAPSAPTASMIDLATRSGGWPATESTLQTAADRLEGTCMKAAGFDLPDRPVVRLPVPEDESAAIGLAKRRTDGYGLSVSDGTGGREPANPAYEALSDAAKKRYQDADAGPGAPHTTVKLYGKGQASVPTSGCVATSRRQLAGDVRTWARITYIPEQLDQRLTHDAQKDTRYLRALDAWRSCMTAHGFRYATSQAAVEALRERYAKDGVSARLKRAEVEVAVADGTCAGQAHLPTILLRVRRALVAHLPPADLTLLAALDRSRSAAVDRARAVLGDDSGGESAEGAPERGALSPLPNKWITAGCGPSRCAGPGSY